MSRHLSFARRSLLFALAILAGACSSSPTSPSPVAREIVVSVIGEVFVVRTADATTIRLAEDNLAGRNNKFPAGPVRRGNGGFNAPWSWHLDPDEVRFVDTATEVCDGRPSYVEADLVAYPRYCPYAAKVIAIRPAGDRTSLVLSFSSPVTARFVPATGVFVAEFPVTIADGGGSGGTLDWVETTVTNVTRGTVVARNRRPNANYVYRDVHLLPGGSLTVEAAVGYPPTPQGDSLRATVQVRLTNGREASHSAPVTQAR